MTPGADEPAPSVHRAPALRRLTPIPLLLAAVIAGAIVVIVSRGPGSVPSPHSAPTPGATATHRSPRPAANRLAAVDHLLTERSRAILHHRRRALLATIDPAARAFRASQAQLLANLRDVPLASWSYTIGPALRPPPKRIRDRYRAPVWGVRMGLHYRLRGFDRSPTDLEQYPTFVDRSGHWYLASLSDYDSRGHVSATDLWDYAPVRVVRRPSVLVLGPPQELATMATVADEITAAIPRVTAVWGPHWRRKVVALVPSTQEELGRIDGDTGDLDHIAALTSAEIQTVDGAPAPVGSRVSINPANWDRLAAVGRRIVITHELTHVASRADTGYRMPTWLVEGLADYVGFRGTGVPTVVAAAELARQVQAGHLPRRLPRDRDFDGDSSRLSVAYEGAWLACRYIAQRYGEDTLVTFYRQVGTSSLPPARALASASHRLLHLSVGQLTRRWRHYVRDELA